MSLVPQRSVSLPTVSPVVYRHLSLSKSIHEALNALTTIDSLLGDFLPQIEEALEMACNDQPGCPDRLSAAIRYSLLAPGKRLRPALVLMAAEACGGALASAIPAAVAVEMVHAYSLIHDDLPAMDDDDLRRGRPTCHKQFDEATAILAGDALLARAFEMLSVGLADHQVAAAVRTLAIAAGPTALVGGQADDLTPHHLTTAEMSGQGSPERVRYLESIHRRKTGALFAASLELGGIAVDANETERNKLRRFAELFGLAFQIVDDLLDSTASSEIVGKRTGKDLERGKLTFPGLIGIEASRRRAAELTETACEVAWTLPGGGQRLADLANFVLQRSH